MAAIGSFIDDLSGPHPVACNGARWDLITDRVMGGVSHGSMRREIVQGRPAIRMQGTVSLANNGGFVQIALDLDPGGGHVDAGGWQGIVLDAFGNGETYGLHLRTTDVRRPWQSYRAAFRAMARWQRHHIPFTDFEPHRIDAPMDPRRLCRIGIVAIGRAFEADIAIGGLGFLAA